MFPRSKSSVVFVWVLLVSTLALVAWAEPSTGSDAWDGLSEFSRLAGRRVAEGRLRIVQTLPLDELTEADSILVLMPESKLEADSLTRFLSDGGKIAILDDVGTSGELLSRFSIRLVDPPLDPTMRLRESTSLPIATRSLVGGKDGTFHPLADGVDKVMTNHPKAVAHPNLSPVLEIPTRHAAPAPVVVTGVVGKGRLVVVSDPSILTNQMIRYPGNRAFGGNLVDYLAPNVEGGHLYVVSGAFDQSGTYGDSSLLERFRHALEGLKSLAKEIEDRGLPEPLAIALSMSLFVLLAMTELWPALRPGRERLPLFAERQKYSLKHVQSELEHAALVAVFESLDRAIFEASKTARDRPPASFEEGLETVNLSSKERDRVRSLRSEIELLLAGERRPPRPMKLHEEARRYVERLNDPRNIP